MGPQHPSLVAVGCYDGTVMVFDVRMKVNRPMYFSTIKKRKHTDPVWQVIWQDEDIGKNLNFYSISSDGRVTNWAMIKNELEPTDIMILQVTGQKTEKRRTLPSPASQGALASISTPSRSIYS